jgi:glycosyltransferase involved in cell wall biosynthesis
MKITVFTPAYNRGHLLHRVYESLCKQTFRDFEWVVVDDGSKDDTRSVVEKFRVESGEWRDSSEVESGQTSDIRHQTSDFPIRYIYQENGGKHRAINRGVKEAQGELFFIVDSDDMLPPEALETVAKVYEDIKDDERFAGVCGLDGTFEGKVIGSGLPQEVIDTPSVDIRFKYGVTGDMKEVFRTAVLKEFPFPEIEGERFCSEMLLWNRIATRYKLRYFNQIIYLAEYQEDGISAGIVKARMKSPIAAMMTYAELNGYDIPFVSKVKAAINYWRFRFCFKKNENEKGRYPKLRWWWNWVMPVGFAMYRRDVSRYL